MRKFIYVFHNDKNKNHEEFIFYNNFEKMHSTNPFSTFLKKRFKINKKKFWFLNSKLHQ
jgi:hypothetical protein